MKDKEKQIEEIKRIIDDRCEVELGQVHANSKDGKVTKTVDTSLIAKDIYKYLTENAVVLSREEYEVLKIKEKEKHWLQTCISIWKNAKIDGSKETAEKIFSSVKKILDNAEECYDADEGLVGYEETGVDKNLTELAKQFGVEIKE